MKRQLFVCNSVYQIFVVLWIKYYLHKEDDSDLIISDHLSNGEGLVTKISELKIFKNVFYVKNVDFAKYKKRLNRKETVYASIKPNSMLKRFLSLREVYTQLYIANVDYFSQLLYDALAHRNSKIELNIYEDGMYTYSHLYEKDYNNTFIPVKSLFKKFIHSYIYRKKTIFGNVYQILLFNPENMLWKPDFKIIALEKIHREDKVFREICNEVFSYSNMDDEYDKKYIFMEESFFAEGAQLNDLQVLDKIAERVGKNNIMVKIHPRNPVNRFEKLGYKTNHNTSIPWEVILMNVDFSKKKLITISSSSILNPRLIFGQYVRAFSIYKCIDHNNCHSRLLSDEMWEIANTLFKKYDDMITICSTIEDIQ